MIAALIIGSTVAVALQVVMVIKFFGMCSDTSAIRRMLAGMAKRDLDRDAKQ